MYVTDEEACKQRCPHFQYVVNENGVIHHGQQPIIGHEMCAGSACVMAWRWGQTLYTKANDPINDENDLQRKGYCGIASCQGCNRPDPV